MDKEFEDKFNKLCSKMKNAFPEEFKACAIALNERKNIWIKDNETNEIIECPVNFFDHLSNVDEVLKIIESTVANVPPQGGRKHPQQECLHIDTTNILFICGGAFVGLDAIIKKRKENASLGFGGNVEKQKEGDYETLREVTPQDLIKYGLIPEFVGRIPITVGLHPLDEKALVNILTEPKNAIIKQFKASFAYDNVELNFTDDAIDAIADTAIKQKTGARGLRAIVEKLLLDLMYEAPSMEGNKRIDITADVVYQKAQPQITDDTNKISA